MYGTQTAARPVLRVDRFENDVKMYGTQTYVLFQRSPRLFENDVKMYGTQTPPVYNPQMTHGLRMM